MLPVFALIFGFNRCTVCSQHNGMIWNNFLKKVNIVQVCKHRDCRSKKLGCYNDLKNPLSLTYLSIEMKGYTKPFTQLDPAPPTFTELHLPPLSSTQLHPVPPSSTELHRAPPSSHHLHSAPRTSTCLRQYSLNCVYIPMSPPLISQ